ncbi:MAG: hypothetical protein JSS24_07900 [Proteobacteria bacterium]|nr:hypothetical protein [Pseudomonadota bacterium]
MPTTSNTFNSVMAEASMPLAWIEARVRSETMMMTPDTSMAVMGTSARPRARARDGGLPAVSFMKSPGSLVMSNTGAAPL